MNRIFLYFCLFTACTAVDWNVWGGNLKNNHNQNREYQIGVSNVNQLVTKWTINAGNQIAGIPTVHGRFVYFNDFGGFLWAVNKNTGDVIWKKNISTFTNLPGSYSRSGPTISGKFLVFGDKASGSGYVLAVNRFDGSLIWKTRIETHPTVWITMSPTIFQGRVFVGTSSEESALALDPSYPCCSFQGSFNALSLHTGALIWKKHLLPNNNGTTGGYSGSSSWGSSPSIDPERNTVYFGTGNTYTFPNSVVNCLLAHPGNQNCISSDALSESIVALDLDTGNLVWSYHADRIDAFNCVLFGTTPNCEFSSCFPAPTDCVIPVYDYDFGQAPMLWRSGSVDYVGAGQKSGYFTALYRNTGSLAWTTQVGPGNFQGGIMWGSATDGQKIYVAEADNNGGVPLDKTYTIYGTNLTIIGGSWAALNAQTGHFIWQTPDPNAVGLGNGNGFATGPVTLANGVLYAASLEGHFYALNAANGHILWSYQSGGSANSGPSVIDGVVYWGTGSATGNGTGANTFYAFQLPGHVDSDDDD
jgi:polyvinyl alcohol dehydrogenase (cytochrome)